MSATERPGPLPGTDPLGPRTRCRLWLWTAREVTCRERAIRPVLLGIVVRRLVPGWVARPLGFGVAAGLTASTMALMALIWVAIILLNQTITMMAWQRRGWLVAYSTRDATQLVRVNEDGDWVLSDHVSRRPGPGTATPFRRHVFAHLAGAADRAGVSLVTSTRVLKLARIYEADMASLQIVDETTSRWGTTTWTLRRPVTEQGPMGHETRGIDEVGDR